MSHGKHIPTDLKNCSKKELIEIVEIQIEEYQKLYKRNRELKGLILRMIDRWWCFVHRSLPSNTASKLYNEAVDILCKKDESQ